MWTTIHQAKPAVVSLMHRYAIGLDQRDRAAIASCFHADARADYSHVELKDREEILHFLDRISVFHATLHQVGTVNVSIVGKGSAHVESYAIAYLVSAVPEGHALTSRGVRYVDEVTRRDGEWRIALRRHRVVWEAVQPAVAEPPLPQEMSR